MARKESVVGGIQSEYLRSVESQHIPSGATIPDAYICSFLSPGSSIVDFGGGTGEKAWHLEELGFHVMLLDVNPHAVSTAKQLGVLAIEVDVKNPKSVQHAVMDRGIHPDAVIMEALLCNMVEHNRENTYQRGLASAARILPKGGKLFIADVLATDDYNPLLQQTLFDWELIKLKELWNNRYTNNEHIGLPRHVFVVAKPGWWKELMEYGPTSDLWDLFRRNEVERFARHFTNLELENSLSLAGFRQISWEYTLWKSRSGRPLSGCVIVGEKE